ncbi:MAG: hypothetical protein AAF217_09295 [Pseudomonadota bacterium]
MPKTENSVFYMHALAKTDRRYCLNAGTEMLTWLADNTDASRFVSCSVEFEIKAWRVDGASLKGQVEAQFEQLCVSSLEPINTSTTVKFERKFRHMDDRKGLRPVFEDGELILDPQSDEPDLLDGPAIKVWDVVLEELNLAIDPFLKIKNEEDQIETPTLQDLDRKNPFAVLGDMFKEDTPDK